MSVPRMRIVQALFAMALATGLLATPQAAPTVAAATPDLSVVTNARYDVQPDRRRVHVTVDLTATNHKTDTAIRRYYYVNTFLQVQPGTKGFKATADSGSPTVKVRSTRKQDTVLEVGFGKRLYSRQSIRIRLQFDIPDPGGSANRDIRIGQALVTFAAWAYGTPSTPGSTVTIAFPPGYSVDVAEGTLSGPTTGPAGELVYQSGALADPFTFFAFLIGDRPGAYGDVPRTTTVGQHAVPLSIRAWEDDPAWATRIGDLFVRGLPTLGKTIGLPYPRTDTLVVRESVSRSLGGYAGLFDPSTGQIEVAYYASAFIVLHEASHAWFNGSLLADRWANEAWASYYGLRAANALKVTVKPPKLTAALQKAKIPLNAWGAIGRETEATEDYAYAATLELARRIAQRATDKGLQQVWQAAAAKVSAYQPLESPAGVQAEQAPGVADWRGLLDLLETKTGKRFDDLWRTWIVRPTETALLDARSEARTDYAATVKQAGDWELPRPIRQAMAAWQFETARGLLNDAREVLARRDAVRSAARAAGLTAPTTLEQAFEGAAGFDAARNEADHEMVVIEAIQKAAAAAPNEGDIVIQLGLWSLSPRDDLAASRDAFAAGDLPTALNRADAALAAWQYAPSAGQNRLTSIVILIAAATFGLILILTTIWRFRRRRRRRRAMAHRATPLRGEGGGPAV